MGESIRIERHLGQDLTDLFTMEARNADIRQLLVKLSDAAGISIVSPTKVTIQAPTIDLQGNVTSNGTFQNQGHDISATHKHGGVATGVGNTGIPL